MGAEWSGLCEDFEVCQSWGWHAHTDSVPTTNPSVNSPGSRARYRFHVLQRDPKEVVVDFLPDLNPGVIAVDLYPHAIPPKCRKNVSATGSN